MTYLVTTISLTPDTRLTEKRAAFSTTLMVCVICVDTLSRMRWSRPADDSRLDDADDVVARDSWLDDAIWWASITSASQRRAAGSLVPTGRSSLPSVQSTPLELPPSPAELEPVARGRTATEAWR